ncbi:MAG: potassium channel protein [Endomicrobiia bacterium]|nr:potassium channel protein [Endomicrobiia bacterium]
MDVYKNIIKTTFILVAVLIAGTLGYIIIEGWSAFDAFYMTVITLATVGYGETHPLSWAGRVFTIILILSGISILLYAVSSITSFFIEGELNKMFRRKKMMKEISRLQNHYVVCGAGRIGAHIIKELDNTSRDFVIVDNNEAALARFNGRLIVKGDVTDENVLNEAGIERAGGLFAALPSDEDNIFLIITARQVNPRIKIVAKSVNDSSVKKLLTAGAATVVQPGRIGGLRMVSEMVRPAAVSFLDVMLKEGKGNLRVEEIEVRNPEIKNPPLEKIKAAGALIVALATAGDYVFNPPADAVVVPGDRLIIMGTPEQIEEIKKSV